MEVELRDAELALLDALAAAGGRSREAALVAALRELALERLCHYSNLLAAPAGDEDLDEFAVALRGRMRRLVRALNQLPDGPRYRLRGPYLQVQAPGGRRWARCFAYRWP